MEWSCGWSFKDSPSIGKMIHRIVTMVIGCFDKPLAKLSSLRPAGRWCGGQAPDEALAACMRGPHPPLSAPLPEEARLRQASYYESSVSFTDPLTHKPDPVDNSTVLFSRRLIGFLLALGLLTFSVCAQACPPPDEAQQPLCPEHQKHDCCKHGSSDSTAAGQIAFTSGCIIKSSPVEMFPAEARDL